MDLLIKNGFVFDPINGINGERMDIAIRNDKIVKSVPEKNSKIIIGNKHAIQKSKK